MTIREMHPVNPIESLQGRTVALVSFCGFPSLLDTPIALSEYPNGKGTAA